MTDFTDRRTSVTPEAVSARLKAYNVRTKDLGGGSRAVIIDGEHVDTIHMGVDEDGRKRTYAADNTAPGWSLGRKTRAVRHVVASHDVRKHRVGGMTEAHWAHVEGG